MTLVVVPFTHVHEATDRSVCAHFAPHVRVEFAYVGDSLTAYWERLCRAWADAEDLIVVEHDIEVHGDVLPQLDACPNLWCTFPYLGRQRQELKQALGCTRFRSELMGTLPELIERFDGHHWQRLDCELATRLHWAGFEPCVHHPAVIHHHDYGAPGGPPPTIPGWTPATRPSAPLAAALAVERPWLGGTWRTGGRACGCGSALDPTQTYTLAGELACFHCWERALDEARDAEEDSDA